MKKLLILLGILAFSSGLTAQETREITYRNIGLDSLAQLLQNETGKQVYYIHDKTANKNLSFNLKGSGRTLLNAITQELQNSGFTLSEYGRDLFVLKGAGITPRLPDGYFAKKEHKEENRAIDYIDALSNTGNVATSASKVYEIGDKDFVKKGDKIYLSGYIRDSRTGEPVAGAAVFNNGTKTFAQSDAYGFYKLLVPPGKNELSVSGYSLEDAIIQLLAYNDGNLDIVVKEKVYALNSIIISAENSGKIRNNEIGIEKVRIDRIKKVPAVFGEADVVKIILTLPGVKSVGEASGGFNVRGGATDQNLVLFNEGTVYNPSHLFGMFSAFNPDIVNDIELYKSSIPVDYGGRISSVLEVKSREGNNKNITGSLGIGLLTTRGHIEGPITPKTTFIFGARATYSDWMLNLLPENSGYNNGTASFYDFTGGINHRINDRNSIHLNGYFSLDGFKFSIDTSYRYQNANASVKWRSNFNEKHSLELSAGYDQYSYKTFDKANNVNSYQMSFNIRQGFAKLRFKSLLSSKHALLYGVNAVYYNLAPGTYLPYGENSLVSPEILNRETAVEGAAFLNYNWQITEKLFLDAGLRYSIFNSDKFYGGPEVRVSGRYMFNNYISLKAGFNSMKQYIHMLSNTTAISPTDIWKLSDKNIRPQDGWQAAGGIYFSLFNNKVEATVEGYYKKMQHYLDYKSGAVLIMNENIANDVVETEGKAYGIECMLKKPLGKFNGWISYTYSRVNLRETGNRGASAINGGNWYDAPFDKPHDFKLVGNYKFTHRYSFSLNVDYSTGRPVTVPISKYYYGGGYRIFYSDRNTYRIPDYFRMDAALNIEPGHKLRMFTHFSFTIGVYNITGRKNAYSIYFDTRNGKEIRGHMLSIFGAPIPYINLNFKF